VRVSGLDHINGEGVDNGPKAAGNRAGEDSRGCGLSCIDDDSCIGGDFRVRLNDCSMVGTLSYRELCRDDRIGANSRRSSRSLPDFDGADGIVKHENAGESESRPSFLAPKAVDEKLNCAGPSGTHHRLLATSTVGSLRAMGRCP